MLGIGKAVRHRSRIFRDIQFDATRCVAVAIYVGGCSGDGEIATVRVADCKTGDALTTVGVGNGDGIGTRCQTGSVFGGDGVVIIPGVGEGGHAVGDGHIERSVHRADRTGVRDGRSDHDGSGFGDGDGGDVGGVASRAGHGDGVGIGFQSGDAGGRCAITP